MFAARFGRDGKLIAGGGEFARLPEISVILDTPDRGELLWDGGFVLRHRLPMRDEQTCETVSNQ